MQSLDAFAHEKLQDRDAHNLRRAIVETVSEDGLVVMRVGRRLLNFCSNDYLNLSRHPGVKAAAAAAAEQYGAGAGASRLVTGNHPLYSQLETRLARLKGTEAACVFGSGYLANIGIIPALAGDGDLILLDELAHACMHGGASMSGATVATFAHNNPDDLDARLRRERKRHRHVLIATEGVFSMDGDVAPLSSLSAVAQAHDAWLMVDDAHGLGVLGDGRGTAFLGESDPGIPLKMGTLSKALGSYGGYLCASRAVIDLVVNRARSLIYSTGLPPAALAAALASLDLIEAHPALSALPLQKARRFTQAAGLPAAQSPIVPIMMGGADTALRATAMLENEGFLVVAIRPPTVPQGTARLRATFTAGHADADIDRLANLVRTRMVRPS